VVVDAPYDPACDKAQKTGNKFYNKFFSLYAVRDKSVFTYNGSAYVVTPAHNFEQKCNSYKWETAVCGVNPQVYKWKSQDNILDVCDSAWLILFQKI